MTPEQRKRIEQEARAYGRTLKEARRANNPELVRALALGWEARLREILG